MGKTMSGASEGGAEMDAMRIVCMQTQMQHAFAIHGAVRCTLHTRPGRRRVADSGAVSTTSGPKILLLARVTPTRHYFKFSISACFCSFSGRANSQQARSRRRAATASRARASHTVSSPAEPAHGLLRWHWAASNMHAAPVPDADWGQKRRGG